MKFDINIMPEAIEKIEAQARYIAIEKSEPQNAEAWLEAVYDAIAKLNSMPNRCSLAPEDEFSTKTIHMLRVKSHLILFTIDDQSKMVDVLSFRAGWQLPIKGVGE